MMQEKTKGSLVYLASDSISAPHGFTTRLGGVSTGVHESLNIAWGNGDSMENVEKNIHILAQAMGFAPENLVCTRQTHTNRVRVVGKEDHVSLCHRDYPECDGLVTNVPGTALMVYTADCTPILLHDPVTGAVGAVHAGWRGTVGAIAAVAVKTMAERFGSDPAHTRAAIGPNIAQCHFETDADVPQAVLAAFGEEAREYIRKQGAKYYVNLKEINALALRRAGVRRIDISQVCTYCESRRYWSHRVTGGVRGSQGAVIVCKEA